MESNNKRIAKNTILLYFRMLLNMGVSLYTVRVILETLGVTDYGIYNVVGGIVTMFSFISNTMSSATQRFFAIELGRKNYDQLKKVFSMTMVIYILIAIIILLLSETVGLWFLNTKLNIPVERYSAANWVYQFTILSFMITMFTIPFNAIIIVHERMNLYAYVSIIEVILKLIIVYLLVLFTFDKLILYAILMFGVTGLVAFIYITYCKKKFHECKISLTFDRVFFREILSYSGWNLFGTIASIFNNQGINILLNLFFGPVVNTAQALAYQVNSAINQLVQNFMMAVRPQIIKYYASGETSQMFKLVLQSSKLSFFLLFLLSMPILLETEQIFSLWLKSVPEYVVLFTRLIIIGILIDSLSYSMIAAIQATGKVKKYQLIVGSVMLINLPISYLFLKTGNSPQVVFLLIDINFIICFLLRLLFVRRFFGFSIVIYFNNVIIPVVIVVSTACVVPLFILFELQKDYYRLIVIIISSIVFSLLSIYFWGLSRNERDNIFDIVKLRLKKLKIFN